MVVRPLVNGVGVEHIDRPVRLPVPEVGPRPGNAGVRVLGRRRLQHRFGEVVPAHFGLRPARRHRAGDIAGPAAHVDGNANAIVLDPLEQFERRPQAVPAEAQILSGVPDPAFSSAHRRSLPTAKSSRKTVPSPSEEINPDGAAMGAHDFARNREPEPGPVRSRRTLEGPKQVVARPLRQAGAVIGDRDICAAVPHPGGRGNGFRARFPGIAGQIREDAEQLLPVAFHRDSGPDAVGPGHAPAGDARRIVDQLRQRDRLKEKLGTAGACEVHDARAEADRPVERAHQGGDRLAHTGVAAFAEAVGDKLCRGQHVAQVVVDLRHAFADRCQMRAVAERGMKPALHPGKLALGHADLVAARGRRVDAALVFGVRAEPHHRLGQPAHRADHEPVQGQKDRRRSQRRDDEGQNQDALGIGDHRLAHRPLVHRDLYPRARLVRGDAADPQHPVFASGPGWRRLPRSRRPPWPCPDRRRRPLPAACCRRACRSYARLPSARRCRPTRGATGVSPAPRPPPASAPPPGRARRYGRPPAGPPDRWSGSARSRGRRSAIPPA